MEITQQARDILIYSAIAIVVIALIILSVILYKVFKIKKTIKKQSLDILSSDSVIEGHLKVIKRPDFGEPIFELRDTIINPLDDEIVEFSINTIIRNNFKNCLMLGPKTAYELISISNKTKIDINVLEGEFNHKEYNEAISKFNFDHRLNISKEISSKDKYDIILLLSSDKNYLPIYEKYINNLNEKGMFLIANVTKNKAWKKELISKINKSNLNYDILKWYKGFILIVK